MKLNDQNLVVLRSMKVTLVLQDGIRRAQEAARRAAAKKQALRMGMRGNEVHPHR